MNTVRRFSQMITEAGIMTTDKAVDAQSFSTILQGYKDVKEIGGDNKGPQVAAILKNVGLGPGYSWCNAFVYTVFHDFCKQKGIPNPLPKTGLVMTHWSTAKTDVSKKITKQQAITDPTLVRPGQVFFKTRQGGGHAGVVIGVDPIKKQVVTMDGNSSDKVSIRRYSMALPELLGFIDYFDDPEFSFELGSSLSALSGIMPAQTGEPTVVAATDIESGPGKEN